MLDAGMRKLAKSSEKHQTWDKMSEEQQILQNMLYNQKQSDERVDEGEAKLG
jgi:hypothetical protein